ncbi:cyclopropane-fatty-acyl-phospholipid synthase family protein [Nocardia sp. BMG51109]|uniref:SAM-dependent methyltransferase n=1 Tax=Nocardia sp. BMG51109 TaxID=1056816 RepID=UPI0004653BD5|nr:class I SAM-dependent methyltransferase [Nocardia sp. BMG51109]
MSSVPTRAAAAAATNRHYDLPPEVFEAFLDARMKYTCGLYRTGGESLDEAQRDKLAYIARLLHVGAGQRVLDIGCGWGSLAVYLAVEHGCRVTAVTPSRVQSEYVRDRAAGAGVTGLVTVETGYFPDVSLPAAEFDAIAMVEVIEHMPDHGAALAQTARMLRRQGHLYLSATCYRSGDHQADAEHRPGSEHAVGLYGFTAMVTLSKIIGALETAGFSIAALTDMTSHYRQTMAHWQQRITDNRQRMEVAAPGFGTEISRYFDTAVASWGYTARNYSIAAVRSRMGRSEYCDDIGPAHRRTCPAS